MKEKEEEASTLVPGPEAYEQHISEKIKEYFEQHGTPGIEDWFAVIKTLRAVFGGKYIVESRQNINNNTVKVTENVK